MNTSEVLDGAADLIERDGWFCLGPIPVHEGARPSCAAVAMQRIHGHAWQEAFHVFARAVGCSPYAWNDAPERTKEEVIAMLRAVAATERAREASPVRVVAETQTELPESVRS